MAKSKKSKILAMALCASVMTGIYASPVMAAELKVELDGQGIVAAGTDVTGTLTIAGSKIATALNGTVMDGQELNLGTGRLTVGNIGTYGGVTANAGFIARSGYYAFVGDTQYAMLANKEYFALGDGLIMGAQDNEKRASFYVDNRTGNVTTKGTLTGTGLTAKGASGGLYVRDVVDGKKTMIYTKAADADGTNTVWIDPENGNISTIGTIGVGFANGLDNNQPTTILDKTGDINVGISYNADGSVAGQKINLDAETGNITLADKATVDGVDVSVLGGNVAGIRRDAAEGAAYGEGVTSIEGSTSFDANGMVVGDNAIVANTDGSFSAGNGSFKVSDGLTTIGRGTLAVTDEGYVTINNGAFSVGPDGMVAVGNSIQFDGETGVVYANDLKAYNNVYSKNYNLEEVGADLDDLTGSVGNIGDNVAGITRDAEDGALPGEGTTTIEDTLSVSGDSVLAQVGSSQLVITEDVAGLSSGNASFALSNNELQLSVAGNGLLVNQFGTNLNGTVNFIGHDGNSYTLSDLEGRVYDLEQKTQNITSTDPGQGGSSEVPPTGDGHTGFEGDVIVGGDINADAGNFNKVNTDEITVGDNTFIDGDSVNSNEGNFKDKVTVGGEGGTSITGDGMTVGTADKGTTVSDSGVSIKNEYGSVETGVVDGKNDVVVTDEDGNRTSLVRHRRQSRQP